MLGTTADDAARPAPHRGRGTRRRWSSSRLSDGQFAALLTLPVIVVLLAIVAYPTLYSLRISFQSIDLIFDRTEDIGLRNYRRALTEPAVWHAVGVTLAYTAWVTAVSLVLAVAGALLLNERFRGRGLLMTIVILPWAISTYATAVIWRYLYSEEWGLFNALLTSLGLASSPINFLSQNGALPAAAVAHAWQMAPLGMYFILATLQVIPEDLYKAAKVDRLKTWGRLRHVVFPYLKTPLLIVAILNTVEAARAFDLIFFLTGGGPGDVSTTLTYDIYRQTFVNRNLGYGAAISWILLLLTFLITTLYFILLTHRRRDRTANDPSSGSASAGSAA